MKKLLNITLFVGVAILSCKLMSMLVGWAGPYGLPIWFAFWAVCWLFTHWAERRMASRRRRPLYADIIIPPGRTFMVKTHARNKKFTP